MVATVVDGLECYIDDFLWPWSDQIPVVLQHGYSRNPRFWNPWIPLLGSDRRIYRPTVRGCGGAPLPPDSYEYDAEHLVSDLLRQLDAQGLDRVDYVGEASGGILGVLLALQVPDRIRSLVLCNTPVAIPAGVRSAHALDSGRSGDAVLKYGVREWCRRTISSRLDPARAPEQLVGWYVSEMGRTPDWVAARLVTCFESADLSERLAEVTQPVLLISGDRGSVWAEEQTRFVEGLRDVRIRFISGVKSGITVLAPDECVAEARSFWSDIESKLDLAGE